MNALRKMVAALVAACFVTLTVLAADASPAGTWKWSQAGRDGASFERKIQLELKDGKLAGKMLAEIGRAHV